MIRCKWIPCRLVAALQFCVAAAALGVGHSADAQMLSVLPVNIFLQPGQRTATLTVTNTGSRSTSIQVRSYDWAQKGDQDELTASNAVIASPPLVTIAPGASQVVRLVLRQAPLDREATYRILLDQIPGPAEPGVVQMVLRLSIPVFALPATRVVPQLKFHLESADGKWFLVGVNNGLSHEALREIVVSASGGRRFLTDSRASPYLLAGSTRRWAIDLQGDTLRVGETVKLTARGIAGTIETEIGVVATP